MNTKPHSLRPHRGLGPTTASGSSCGQGLHAGLVTGHSLQAVAPVLYSYTRGSSRMIGLSASNQGQGDSERGLGCLHHTGGFRAGESHGGEVGAAREMPLPEGRSRWTGVEEGRHPFPRQRSTGRPPGTAHLHKQELRILPGCRWDPNHQSQETAGLGSIQLVGTEWGKA